MSNTLNLFDRFRNEEFEFHNNVDVQTYTTIRLGTNDLHFNSRNLHDYYNAKHGIKYAIKMLCIRSTIDRKCMDYDYITLFNEPLILNNTNYDSYTPTDYHRFISLSKEHASTMLEEYHNETNNNKISLSIWYEKLPEEYKPGKSSYTSLPSIFIPEKALIELLVDVDSDLHQNQPDLFDHFRMKELPIFLSQEDKRNIKTIIKEFMECCRYNERKSLSYAIANQIQIRQESFHHWIRLNKNLETNSAIITPLPYNTQFWGNQQDTHLIKLLSNQDSVLLNDFVKGFETELWERLHDLSMKLNLPHGEELSYPEKFLPEEVKKAITAYRKKNQPFSMDSTFMYDIYELENKYCDTFKIFKSNIYQLLHEKKIIIKGTTGLDIVTINNIFADLLESNQLDFENNKTLDGKFIGIKVLKNYNQRINKDEQSRRDRIKELIDDLIKKINDPNTSYSYKSFLHKKNIANSRHC